jgi:hypothetical protein
MARRVSFTLEIPLHLGAKQPAIVRLGIGRRTESAGIGTFLDRSGRSLQRVAPDRVGGEDSQLRTGEKSTLRFDRWSDGKDAHVSATAESSRTKGAWINSGITVRLKTTNVIDIAVVSLALDCNVVRDPDNRSDTGFVYVTRGRSVLDDEIGCYSVRSGWKDRVSETFLQPETF